MLHACIALVVLLGLVPMLSGGALAGIAFLAILVFGLIAVMSLTRHIRRSRTPWPGEVDGGVPLDDTTGAGTTDRGITDAGITDAGVTDEAAPKP